MLSRRRQEAPNQIIARRKIISPFRSARLPLFFYSSTSTINTSRECIRGFPLSCRTREHINTGRNTRLEDGYGSGSVWEHERRRDGGLGGGRGGLSRFSSSGNRCWRRREDGACYHATITAEAAFILIRHDGKRRRSTRTIRNVGRNSCQ